MGANSSVFLNFVAMRMVPKCPHYAADIGSGNWLSPTNLWLHGDALYESTLLYRAKGRPHMASSLCSLSAFKLLGRRRKESRCWAWRNDNDWCDRRDYGGGVLRAIALKENRRLRGGQKHLIFVGATVILASMNGGVRR
jgi:hypothetical protein